MFDIFNRRSQNFKVWMLAIVLTFLVIIFGKV